MRLGQHALFGLLLAVGATRALSGSTHFVWMLIGILVFAAWYALGMWLAPRMRQAATGRRYGAVWLLILTLGWVALIVASGEFSWVAFSLFLLAMQLLPTLPAVTSVVAITVVVIVSQLVAASGDNVAARVIGPVMGALVATGMSMVYRRLTRENEQRRRLVQELLQAQEDLVAAQDQLATAQRESGALAERARLARDIHDTLAQGFSSILLLARAGLVDDQHGPPRRTVLAQIESTAAENLDEARRVVHALAPAELESGSPLTAALGRLVDRLSEQTGISTELVVDRSGIEPPTLPTTYDVALLRLAQSALANVRQHAQAQHATVTVTFGAEAITLDVVDDGVGFDPQRAVHSSGFGLRAMRARLAELGGTVRVESAPGEGTAVVARLPLPAEVPR